ncbi:MAG TPA: hypothetical protein VFT22_27450 [Kofleriaceae bacterium]|nr:hypothetical protein [Kofleriaceae bacterium]
MDTRSLAGIFFGHRTVRDAPRRSATAAIVTVALTGLWGCGTTGLGGALGVVVGLLAGGHHGLGRDPRMTVRQAGRTASPIRRAKLPKLWLNG